MVVKNDFKRLDMLKVMINLKNIFYEEKNVRYQDRILSNQRKYKSYNLT